MIFYIIYFIKYTVCPRRKVNALNANSFEAIYSILMKLFICIIWALIKLMLPEFQSETMMGNRNTANFIR